MGGRRRIVAEHDGLADEEGVDLVEASVEADGSVLHDAALGLEQEQVVEVGAGVGVAHVGAGGGLWIMPRRWPEPLRARTDGRNTSA